MSDRCPNCGGSLIGDGYTAVIHCENATDVDAIAEAEADAGPIYCAPMLPDRILSPATLELERDLTAARERADLAHAQVIDLARRYDVQATDLAAARAEVVRLRESLITYGSHKIGCNVYHNGRPCNCGFGDAAYPRVAMSGAKAEVT